MVIVTCNEAKLMWAVKIVMSPTPYFLFDPSCYRVHNLYEQGIPIGSYFWYEVKCLSSRYSEAQNSHG